MHNIQGRAVRLVLPALELLVLLPLVPAAHAEGEELETIVVTARRQEESLQVVPVSIQALSAEAIEKRDMQSLADLALEVPGLSFYSLSGGGLSAPTMRGLSKTSTAGFENNVAVFYDNVFLDNSAILDTGFVDLERIEVAFGPQSALYGRNAFAGAIAYVPKNPGDQWEGSARVTAGNASRKDAALSAGGPLGDKFGVHASYSYSEFDGTVRNLYGGRNLGGWDSKEVAHGVLQYTPTDSLLFRARILYTQTEGLESAIYKIGGQPGFNVGGIANDCGPTGGPGGTLRRTFCGTVPGLDGSAFLLVSNGEETGASNDMTLTSFLAQGTWSALTGSLQYGRVRSNASGIQDTTLTTNRASLLLPGSTALANTFSSPFAGPSDAESFELKLSSPEAAEVAGRPLQWLFGASNYEAVRSQDIRFYDLRGPGGSLRKTISVLNNDDVDEWAVFGRFAVTFGARTTLSLEARYTDQEKCGKSVADLRALIPELVNNTNFGCFSTRSTTPRVTLDYRVNDDVFVYGSFAKGTKAGGFNSPPFPTPGEQYFGDEVNETYEAGVKATWLDGRALTNLTVYYIDWTNLQLQTVSSSSSLAARPRGMKRQSSGNSVDFAAYVDSDGGNEVGLSLVP